jgi:hypothetical protein
VDRGAWRTPLDGGWNSRRPQRLDKPGGPVMSLLFLIFMVGVLVAGLRRNELPETAGRSGPPESQPPSPSPTAF